MVVNFYFDDLNFPTDVREYDHVDLYFNKDWFQFEFYQNGDEMPSRVVKVNNIQCISLKGLSFDG